MATELHAPSAAHVTVDGLTEIAEIAATIKARATELLLLSPGLSVLDVGCGPGLDTAEMAARVASAGSVIGIDASRAMVEAANQYAVRAPHGRIAHHLRADARNLPFKSRSFDRSRCERLLQHVATPTSVIVEIARVTKPGGTMVFVDTDWASLSIDCLDSDLERRIVGAVAKHLPNGYAGRQLLRYLRECGLATTQIELWPLCWTRYDVFRRTSFQAAGLDKRFIADGSVSVAEWARFVDCAEEADVRNTFFASANITIVSARTH